GRRPLEVFTLEQVEARDAPARRGAEPQILALEGAAVGEGAEAAAPGDHPMALDRGPEPAEFHALVGREIPQDRDSRKVGVGALDRAEAGRAVIIDDDVVREERPQTLPVLRVEAFDGGSDERHPRYRDGVDRGPARPRLALRGAGVVEIEEDERSEGPRL